MGTQWSKSDASTNAPSFKILANDPGKGANLYQNVTGAVFGGPTTQAVGLFAVDPVEAKNKSYVVTPGWVLVKQGMGGVTSVAVANDGASYANLACGFVSNGTSNGQFHVTVNSIGHVLTLVLDNAGGLFVNAASVKFDNPANGIATFTIGGGTGYANSDTVRVSNGVINATASVTTNATGGITALALGPPTYGGRGFPGANSMSVVTLLAANGAASAGTNGNVSVATIGGGAGLVITPSMGGRAGRIQYETLVELSSITGTSNNAIFTNT